MPHISLEYSANLDAITDMGALCEALRLAALETGLFPLAGIRVRALACAHYVIADGQPEHGFIDISVRLRAGRPFERRKAASRAIFEAARKHLQPVLETRGIALSLEMRDIDPELSPKINTIRDRIVE